MATVKTSQKKNKVAKTSKKAVGLTDLTLANLGSDDDSSDEDFNEQILNGSAEEDSDSDEASEDQDSGTVAARYDGIIARLIMCYNSIPKLLRKFFFTSFISINMAM